MKKENEKPDKKIVPKTPDTTKDKDNFDVHDKYLAMEQEGVQYTKDSNPTRNSDHNETANDELLYDEANDTLKISRDSEVYDADDTILEDNIEISRESHQSVSSDQDDEDLLSDD